MGKHQRILSQLLHPFYAVNMLLSVMFFVTKTVPPICTTMYNTCHIDFHEYELLIFLGSFVALRSKRQFSIPDYLSHFCLFAKILSVYMFWKQNAVYAVGFGLLWLMQACFCQQPTYSGPDRVLYLRDTTFDQEVVHGDSRTTWLVAFYTAWSPACIKLQPIFAELSEEYGLDFLKFGKLDITRYPDIAKKYSIDTSGWSKQLPTLILFRKGKEITRRPAIVGVNKKSIQKFFFTWENIVNSFSLGELYMECKKSHPTPKPIEAETEEPAKDKIE
ncbi:unnamed protein product [Echinostoma caproni]|uniref:Protein disulfide-isomerase n=1 Tax=Echinostoma caproni TaxID=27848 RepID=A0A183AEV1_9TREM|nr:unnamed protein product [Echinostoma caproni]